MATYKVPQDVEADDKLIGPFSFRQFIYLIIVALAIAGAWAVAQLFIGLIVIFLPIILFFGVLALPLRKDQPMEIYMAAMVSFYLKPRKRLWDPEGIETLIEITAPKTYEESRTKNLSQGEADQRFSYLANIVDSGGWAIRGSTAAPNAIISNDVMLEAQGAVDVFDTNNSVAQSFNQMIAQNSNRAKEEAVERMKTAVFAPSPVPVVTNTPVSQPVTDLNLATPAFNPYPTNIQQTVIQPLNDAAHNAPQNIIPEPVVTPKLTPPKQSSPTTSETPIPTDIINLVNNAEGLSVATLQSQGDRIHKKLDEESEDIVVSLR